MSKEAKYVKSRYLKQYLAESRGLERDYIGEILNSRRNAWRICSVVTALGLMGLAAGMIGINRAAPMPLVLRVDNATGAVDVVTNSSLARLLNMIAMALATEKGLPRLVQLYLLPTSGPSGKPQFL